jgi:hypothetical protein
MPTILADLTRLTSRLVNRHASGAATSSSGNATTLIDTTGLVNYPDDHFNGGTIWLLSGANAGKSRAITDFVASTTTLTFATAGTNIASGVQWEACDNKFVTYQDLRQAVNMAILESGKILGEPDETLTTVDGQWVYDLPTGVYDVEKVMVVTDIGETTEAEYISTHWEERQGQLIFDQGYQPDVDKTLRIYARTGASNLSVDADELDPELDDESIIYMAARQAMRLAYKHYGKAGDENIPEWLNEAAEEAKKHARRNRGTPMIRVRTA